MIIVYTAYLCRNSVETAVSDYDEQTTRARRGTGA